MRDAASPSAVDQRQEGAQLVAAMAVGSFGGLDILVNNLTAPFLPTSAVLAPLLSAARGGHVRTQSWACPSAAAGPPPDERILPLPQ